MCTWRLLVDMMIMMMRWLSTSSGFFFCLALFLFFVVQTFAIFLGTFFSLLLLVLWTRGDNNIGHLILHLWNSDLLTLLMWILFFKTVCVWSDMVFFAQYHTVIYFNMHSCHNKVTNHWDDENGRREIQDVKRISAAGMAWFFFMAIWQQQI